MKKYRFLLFDLDDTLIDNLENVRHAFKVMLNYMGEDYTEEKFVRWYNLDKQFWLDKQNGKIVVPDEYMESKDTMIRWTRSKRYTLYFNNITLEEAMKINDLYIEALNEIVIPIEGAYETLKYLSDKYDIIVATNGPSLATESKLKKIGCLKFVRYILAADMFGCMKPTIEFFEAIKNQIDCHESDKYLVIGDSLKTDVEGAMNANMDSCWFNRNNEPLKEGYKPTMIISDLKELIKKL
jgi:2-haloacid dehalogenase